jgi:hypothetical protein
MLGKNKNVNQYGVGMVNPGNEPDTGFLDAVSTVKDPAWNIGDYFDDADGSRYRYCKAGGTVKPYWGVGSALTSLAVAVAPAQDSTLGATGAIGAKAVTITLNGTTSGLAGDGVIAEDELRGGRVVIGNGSNQLPQMRTILGNTAVGSAGTTCTLFLSRALNVAITVGTTTIETQRNVYAYAVAGSDGGYTSFFGIPCAAATVGQYFWAQTRGKCWITSDGNTCNSAQDRTIVFVANGSVVSSNDVTVESGLQIAGYASDASSSGSSNAPFVQLLLE